MTFAEILLIAIPGIPALAVILLLALAARQPRSSTGSVTAWIVTAGVGGAALAALALLLAPAISLKVPAQPVVILQWLKGVGSVPLDATLSLQADRFGLLLAAVMGFAHTTIALGTPVDSDPATAVRRGCRQLALFTAAVLVVLGTNWLMFLAFWLCVTVIGAAGISSGDTSAASGRKRLTPVVWQLIADIPLVLAVLLIRSTVGTFDMAAMPAEPQGWLALFPRNPAITTVIGLYVLPSILARWAPSPLGAAIETTPDATPSAVETAMMQMATCGPLGLWLLIRLMPLVHASPVLASTLLACGGMLAFFGTATSLTRPSLPGVLTFLWTGLSGFVIIACGLSTWNDTTSLTGGILLMVSQVCVMTGMMITVGREGSRYGLALVAGGLLASGLYGQNGMIDGLWELAIPGASATTATDVGGRSPIDPTPLIMFGFATIAISLWGLALFRGLLRQHREGDNADRSVTQPVAFSRAASVLMVAGLLIAPLLAGLDLASAITPAPSATTIALSGRPATGEAGVLDLTSTAGGTLLAMIGMVIGWLLYSRPSPWPARLADRLGPLTRLSRHGGYLESTISAVVETVLGVSSRLVGWLEPVTTDGLSRHLRRHAGSTLDEWSKPLRNGPVQFQATGIVLAATLLLLTLLWWRG